MSTNTTDANRAPPQGGVIEGANPSKYNPSDPITLFIIQAGLIIIVCHALHWPLSKIRQPRVIAEVVGGIILGPSVMGRIPGFQQAIFPKESIPNLSLVANLGLILYLFLIGMETDVGFLVKNWRVATSVAVAGLALPFAVGCGLAWGIYHAFRNDAGLAPIGFGTYMLFIGIAIAITAFPVLCRILSELKLLDTSVGVITLSAGVANDVVGWVLLALCVTLVNAGNGLTALYILLCCAGFVLLLGYVIKPALIWLLRRTGSLQNGPSQGIVSLIMLLALASAFFTGIIGVHPIFGAFMVGLIIPRENRFNIKVTEKMEDLIGALLLPLYFTLSGLKTNLGLLDSGLAWGYVFATTIVAFSTKIIGASCAARLNGLVWRESLTIGVLMSCKGLVELIVLNIGLQANILSTRTFTIFVVMALLTTFSTTPLVSWLYPPWYQKKMELWRRGEIDWDTGALISTPSNGANSNAPREQSVARVLVYLRLDTMPRLLRLVSLFGNPSRPLDTTTQSENASQRPVRAHGLRLLQLTDRDSSVMTVSQVDSYSRHDPVVNTFQTVTQSNHLSVSGEVAIMPEHIFSQALVTKATAMAANLLLVPWSETGNIVDSQILSSSAQADKLASPYTSFVSSILDTKEHNIAVFFTRSDSNHSGPQETAAGEKGKLTRQYSLGMLRQDFPIAAMTRQPYHIFMIYIGGADDDFALRLVLQLCEGSQATATILKAREPDAQASSSTDAASCLDGMSDELSARVHVEHVQGRSTVEELIHHASTNFEVGSQGNKSSLIVVGRHAGDSLDEGKLKHAPAAETNHCLGILASQVVEEFVEADVLIVQAVKPTDVSVPS
ncbi:K+ homeostasis protein Kha1 [Cordyceps fumosorosea ARSEF 2679]|uniref:K+ homeostasis protein Kha1 n=1 Tax=Cordyceps fumosorosea (strain ARSEF 2679) TaxID=1081104 RepID=A0A167LDY3_CORFA|nr:K+ homeostasis protein Kha1 [Cordyceps fumosorosea ARSEF 2679]OAA52973.1 K+ homeostasis protein Kha1 [Cordyceps fumosorosea ARSEF 2679]